MSKFRQSALKKSDVKVNQLKISAFFKKSSSADQKLTSLKYTSIRPDVQVVLESPKRAVEIVLESPQHAVSNRQLREGANAKSPDVIPATPRQLRPQRLFSRTNCLASSDSPECDVIPPTPRRPGKSVSLAYKLLQSKCDSSSVHTALSENLHTGSFESNQLSSSYKSLQTTKANCQDLTEEKVSRLSVNSVNATRKRDTRKTPEYDARVSKRPKLANISPSCELPTRVPLTPLQHDNGSSPFKHHADKVPFGLPECEVIPPTPPSNKSRYRFKKSRASKLVQVKCSVKPAQQTDLKLTPLVPISLEPARQIDLKCTSLVLIPSDKVLQTTKASCNVNIDQESTEETVGSDSVLQVNGLNATHELDTMKIEDADTKVAQKPESGVEVLKSPCELPNLGLQTNDENSKDEFLTSDYKGFEKPLKCDSAEANQSVLLFDDDDFFTDFVPGTCTEADDVKREKKTVSETESFANRACNTSYNDLPIRKYNRHKVRQVIRDQPGETLVMVSPLECSSTVRTCILKGFWAETRTCEGDIVNVLGEFNENGTVVMGGDQKDNLLVVNPDCLVSTTTVVGGVFCRRKTVLKEWFRAVEPPSIHMLVGILVHQLFQEAAEKRLTTPQEVRQLLAEITRRKDTLQQIYGFQRDKDFGRFYTDLDSFVKPVSAWIRQHIVGNGQPAGDQDPRSRKLGGGRFCKTSAVNVKQIRDIEENVWCPRLGLKGKLDVVVETSGGSIVPLELKTGRPTFSAEHEGQVTLYRMMSRDRRPKEVDGDGLLLYLRSGECQEVKYKAQAQQQLIQMRNEVAWHLVKPLMEGRGQAASKCSLAPLPDPLSSRRVCSGCPLLTVCSLLSSQEDAAGRSREYAELSQSAVEHLIQKEPHTSPKEYFFKWCLNVFTEDLSTKDAMQLKDVWCETAERREERGECFSGMVLKPIGDKRQPNVHRFVRCTGHRNGKTLPAVGFDCMQMAVVSIEKKNLLALATGSIKDVKEDYVDVVLDRDLYSKGDYEGEVFRIDAYRPQTYSVTALSNLARLMDNSAASTRLRSLIIRHEPLGEKLLLSRESGKRAKPFFGNLNRQQKVALLTSLATKDYVLIEGTPGSGKTKTVVAMIQMLLHTGNTILLASHTHSAVDNVLLKLKEKGVENFIRLGKNERINPRLADHTSERLLEGVDSLEKINEVFNSKQLVAATCLGTSHGMFRHRNEFDYCIIDEAAQILQPVCLGPLLLCKRFILVGDPQQLPPVVRSPVARQMGMDESLFALLKSKERPKDDSQSSSESRNVLLSEQYRMNAEIMRFANALSYEGKLECNNANRLAVLALPKFDEVGHLLQSDSLLSRVASTDLEDSVLLLNTDQLQALEERDSRGKVCSRVEAIITVEIVVFFLKCGLNVNQVGVISPYRNQVALIKKVMAQKKMEEPLQFADFSEVEVNTIDQYQGREKDVVIISFVGRSKAGATQDQEILCDKRRINVAITRARTKMVMIGSQEVLRCYEPLDAMLKLMRPDQVVDLTSDCIASLHWPLKAELASL